MEIILKLEMRVMKFFLLVSDVGNSIANRPFNRSENTGELALRGTHLTADHDTVRRREGFAGNSCFRFSGQKEVQNGIRYTVTQLVGMSL